MVLLGVSKRAILQQLVHDVLSTVNRTEVQSCHVQAVSLVEQTNSVQPAALSNTEIELHRASVSIPGKHKYARETKCVRRKE